MRDDEGLAPARVSGIEDEDVRYHALRRCWPIVLASSRQAAKVCVRLEWTDGQTDGIPASPRLGTWRQEQASQRGPWGNNSECDTGLGKGMWQSQAELGPRPLRCRLAGCVEG